MTDDQLTFRPLVFLGFGSVSQCLIPLLTRYFEFNPAFLTIVEPRDVGRELTPWVERGARWVQERITTENYGALLTRWAPPGAVIVDLSVNVDSHALVSWCRDSGRPYINASVELWDLPHELQGLSPQQRTLYPRHRSFAPWREEKKGPTAVLDHGVNPGLVSHFVKAALVDLAAALAHPGLDGRGFGVLARELGVKVIHIAEKDSQKSGIPRAQGEFVNTWSVDGLIEEAVAPAEMGWGSHESELPHDAHVHNEGPRHQICLTRPGFKTRVRTWVPSGPTFGMVIRHGEAYTITEHLSVTEGDQVAYRPTVHYAYHPSEATRASLDDFDASGMAPPDRRRVMTHEIIDGTDELGVLLMGHPLRAWWYGSELTCGESRELVPGQNATTVQVAAGMAAALLWMLKNPDSGVLVPDDLPWKELLDTARPFLGKITSRAVSWGPGDGRDSVSPAREWDFSSFLLD